MKLLLKTVLLLALHDAHASLRHKATIEDGPPDNFRRNLRFGNTGGDGCCFPYFAPWAGGF